jgi:DNA-binding response OmpR family regulator
MKTLVIEDDLKSQCLLAKVLAERGHEVTTFENAEQAILAHQQAFFPLVIVDAGLPGMDGLQFCRWIRSQPKGDRVFVIVATELDLPQDMNQVLELGANDFLSKPYELNGLRARLSIAEQQMERFFEQQKLEQALEGETKRWTQVEAEMAVLREGYEKQLRERDEELAALRRQRDQASVSPKELDPQLVTAETQNSPAIHELEKSRDELAQRVQEYESLLTASRASEQESLRVQSGLQDELMQVKQVLSSRGGAGEGDVAKMRDSLRLQREQSERLAAALGEMQQERSTRIRELEDQVTRLRAGAEEDHARRERAEMELMDVREQLAARVKGQTGELLELSEQLKTYLSDRKRLDLELNETRDDLARRVREQLTEVLRLSDELKTAKLERQRVEDELAHTRREQMDQSHRAQQELEESVRQFQNESTERQRLEESLHAERERVETIVAERRAVEGLLEESLRADQTQREETNRLMERAHQEAEEQRGQLNNELQKVRDKVQEQESELSRLSAELISCKGTMTQLEEAVVTHRQARKHAESRWRALAQLGPELNLAETPDEIARAVANLAQDLVGWEAFSFDAYVENGDWIHPVLNLETTEGRVVDSSPLHPGPQPSSMMRRVLEDGPQLLLRPAPSCSQTDLVAFGDRARRSSSMLYVPVKSGHHVLGFLSVRSAALDAYDGDDIDTLMTLTALCAGALVRLDSKGCNGGEEKVSRCDNAMTTAGVTSEC